MLPHQLGHEVVEFEARKHHSRRRVELHHRALGCHHNRLPFAFPQLESLVLPDGPNRGPRALAASIEESRAQGLEPHARRRMLEAHVEDSEVLTVVCAKSKVRAREALACLQGGREAERHSDLALRAREGQARQPLFPALPRGRGAPHRQRERRGRVEDLAAIEAPAGRMPAAEQLHDAQGLDHLLASLFVLHVGLEEDVVLGHHQGRPHAKRHEVGHHTHLLPGARCAPWARG